MYSSIQTSIGNWGINSSSQIFFEKFDVCRKPTAMLMAVQFTRPPSMEQNSLGCTEVKIEHKPTDWNRS